MEQASCKACQLVNPRPRELPCFSCSFVLVCWQVHKAELKALQSQLDQAYSDLSELQYNSDQDKAALEDQVQAAQEQIKVRSDDLVTYISIAHRPGTLLITSSTYAQYLSVLQANIT